MTESTPARFSHKASLVFFTWEQNVAFAEPIKTLKEKNLEVINKRNDYRSLW